MNSGLQTSKFESTCSTFPGVCLSKTCFPIPLSLNEWSRVKLSEDIIFQMTF